MQRMIKDCGLVFDAAFSLSLVHGGWNRVESLGSSLLFWIALKLPDEASRLAKLL